jgi:hypothetical protein
MKKLHFATKVTVARVQRSDASSSAAERTKLQAEINSRPVTIDRSVFRKSDAEKAELKIEKAHWKRKMSI